MNGIKAFAGIDLPSSVFVQLRLRDFAGLQQLHHLLLRVAPKAFLKLLELLRISARFPIGPASLSRPNRLNSGLLIVYHSPFSFSLSPTPPISRENFVEFRTGDIFPACVNRFALRGFRSLYTLAEIKHAKRLRHPGGVRRFDVKRAAFAVKQHHTAAGRAHIRLGRVLALHPYHVAAALRVLRKPGAFCAGCCGYGCPRSCASWSGIGGLYE